MLNEKISIHAAEGTWVVRAGGAVLGETSRALEYLEENFLPVIYFPREDLGMAFFDRSETVTTSKDLGTASYFSIVTKSTVIQDAAWSYETPPAPAARIAGHIAFYPNRVTIEQV